MRQIIQQIAQGSYAPGQQNILIPRTNYLSRLWFNFNGTLDNSGTAAGTAGPGAPWSLIQQMRLNVNGNIFPVSLGGYELYMVDRVMRPDYLDNSTFGVAAGNNAVAFHLMVPVTVTDDNLTGIILAGNPSTTIYLEVTFRQASDPLFATPPSGATLTLTGTWEVLSETFEVGPHEQHPDISTLHTLTQIQTDITGTGKTYVDLPTQNNVYLRIIHLVKNGGAYVDGLIDNAQLKLQDYVSPYSYDEATMLNRQRYLYLTDLPAGTYVHDLFTSRTLRDVINTTGMTEFQGILDIPSTATITQPATVTTITEALTPLQ